MAEHCSDDADDALDCRADSTFVAVTEFYFGEGSPREDGAEQHCAAIPPEQRYPSVSPEQHSYLLPLQHQQLHPWPGFDRHASPQAAQDACSNCAPPASAYPPAAHLQYSQHDASPPVQYDASPPVQRMMHFALQAQETHDADDSMQGAQAHPLSGGPPLPPQQSNHTHSDPALAAHGRTFATAAPPSAQELRDQQAAPSYHTYVASAPPGRTTAQHGHAAAQHGHATAQHDHAASHISHATADHATNDSGANYLAVAREGQWHGASHVQDASSAQWDDWPASHGDPAAAAPSAAATAATRRGVAPADVMTPDCGRAGRQSLGDDGDDAPGGRRMGRSPLEKSRDEIRRLDHLNAQLQRQVQELQAGHDAALRAAAAGRSAAGPQQEHAQCQAYLSKVESECDEARAAAAAAHEDAALWRGRFIDQHNTHDALQRDFASVSLEERRLAAEVATLRREKADMEAAAARSRNEAGELREQLRATEDDVRRRLLAAGRAEADVGAATHALLQSLRAQVADLGTQNARLAFESQSARDAAAQMRKEVERLRVLAASNAPPAGRRTDPGNAAPPRAERAIISESAWPYAAPQAEWPARVVPASSAAVAQGRDAAPMRFLSQQDRSAERRDDAFAHSQQDRLVERRDEERRDDKQRDDDQWRRPLAAKNMSARPDSALNLESSKRSSYLPPSSSDFLPRPYVPYMPASHIPREDLGQDVVEQHDAGGHASSPPWNTAFAEEPLRPEALSRAAGKPGGSDDQSHPERREGRQAPPAPHGYRRGNTAATGSLRDDTPFGTEQTVQEMVVRNKRLEDALMVVCRERDQLQGEYARMPAHSGRSLKERERKRHVELRIEQLNREASAVRLHLKKLVVK